MGRTQSDLSHGGAHADTARMHTRLTISRWGGRGWQQRPVQRRRQRRTARDFRLLVTIHTGGPPLKGGDGLGSAFDLIITVSLRRRLQPPHRAGLIPSQTSPYELEQP